MDSEDAPRSRPRPWLLLAGTLSLAGALTILFTTRMPGKTWTYAQAAQVYAIGHKGAIKVKGDCRACHR